MTKENKSYDVIIVGGGIAGLTAALYLSKSGLRPIIFEKSDQVGGMINSFNYKGFVFDGGIRSIESSGVVKTLIKDFNLDIKFDRSLVTYSIEDKVIKLESKENLKDYENLLISLFPNDEKDIKVILKKIYKILKIMDVLYGIDNPMIVDIKNNKKYVLKTLLPWLPKFIPSIFKIDKLNIPVQDYLKRFTLNQSLIDMIIQHFFKSTPAFFALGYFSLYFDYHYPKGGTSKLPLSIENKILEYGGKIVKNTSINYIDIENKYIKDDKNNIYYYKKLIWGADLKALYSQININNISNIKSKNQIILKNKYLEDKIGAESVLTVYATVNLDPSYFKNIASEHFFYTKSKIGLSDYQLIKPKTLDEMYENLKNHYLYNTFEISIPVLRDPSLAPKGQTGLIISILMDYGYIKHILDLGLYDEFKKYTESEFIKILSYSIFKDLNKNIIETFCSTPLTFKTRLGSSDGSIIGWAYHKDIPVHHKMSKITKSIYTINNDIYQIGQWSFSPAGVPISIITGKLSADKVKKELHKKKFRSQA